MKSREQIKLLVEKFLDGRTTNAEERELYAWFRSADVPEEWAELKAMFEWYDAGMPDDVGEAKPHVELSSRISGRGLWFMVGALSGVAASVVVALTMWFAYGQTNDDSLSVYAGSYIVDNGIRYDDIDDIEGDIEDLLARADAIEESANELLAWAEM